MLKRRFLPDVPFLNLLGFLTPQSRKSSFIITRGDPAEAEPALYLGQEVHAKRPNGSIVVINHFEFKSSTEWEPYRQYPLFEAREVGGIRFIPGFYEEPFWRYTIIHTQEGEVGL